jgi:hypothetical protein
MGSRPTTSYDHRNYTETKGTEAFQPAAVDCFDVAPTQIELCCCHLVVSCSTETTVEVQEGMDIDRGYISPQFVNNPERLLVEYDNCRVLVTDQRVSEDR